MPDDAAAANLERFLPTRFEVAFVERASPLCGKKRSVTKLWSATKEVFKPRFAGF